MEERYGGTRTAKSGLDAAAYRGLRGIACMLVKDGGVDGSVVASHLAALTWSHSLKTVFPSLSMHDVLIFSCHFSCSFGAYLQGKLRIGSCRKEDTEAQGHCAYYWFRDISAWIGFFFFATLCSSSRIANRSFVFAFGRARESCKRKQLPKLSYFSIAIGSWLVEGNKNK